MEKTIVHLDTHFRIGQVDQRIFGGFMEHLGDVVYGGVYDPESAYADEAGLRSDVAEALQRLRYTCIRYPGGNFVSGYHWMDGVGPVEERPRVQERAWHTVEPNTFGTDEFMQLCRKMDWEPMLTVNLGTGTPEEAANWVEYCNSPAGTKYADLRVANGHSEPYNVKLWFLGNEMDGPWQLGHVPAEQYALRAQQAAKMMRDVDASIELVICGSCALEVPTYMSWDRKVLDYVGDLADYSSIHRYVRNENDDTLDYLAVTNSIDRQIEDADAACRFVQAKRRSAKRAFLSFDEWSPVHRREEGGGFSAYNLEDALVAAGFLHSFIRHADVVKLAHHTMVMGRGGPVDTRGDEILLQTLFYPLAMFATRGRGMAITPIVSGPQYEGKTRGEVPYIDSSAIWDEDELKVFLTNRSPDETAPVDLALADRDIVDLVEAEILTGADAKDRNTFEAPDTVQSQPFREVRLGQGVAQLEMPPLSLMALTLRVE